MKKIKFDRPLSAAFSPNVPTTIREYDSTQVEERIKSIRTAFTTLTASIKQLESQIESNQRQTEARIREMAMEIVRGFALSDEELILSRLRHFMEDMSDVFSPGEDLRIAVNAQTADLIPRLVEEIETCPKIEIDATLQNGECRVESNQQGMFMSLDAQLDQIRNRLQQKASAVGAGQ